MDLFRNEEVKTFSDILTELRKMADGFVDEFELPERGVRVFENIGTGIVTKGKVISYSVEINEPDYPSSVSDMEDENRTHVKLVSIVKKESKSGDFLLVTIDSFVASILETPKDAEVLPRNKTDEELGKIRIQFPINSRSFIGWLENFIRYRIKNYTSSAKSFGCCSRFKECSEALKCVHPNRLYSTACAYRRNLENGNNFMGD